MSNTTHRQQAGLVVASMWAAFWLLATVVGQMIHGANGPETVSALLATALLTGTPIALAAWRNRGGALVLAFTGLALGVAILGGTNWLAIPALRLLVLSTLPLPPLIAAALLWPWGDDAPIAIYDGSWTESPA